MLRVRGGQAISRQRCKAPIGAGIVLWVIKQQHGKAAIGRMEEAHQIVSNCDDGAEGGAFGGRSADVTGRMRRACLLHADGVDVGVGPV